MEQLSPLARAAQAALLEALREQVQSIGQRRDQATERGLPLLVCRLEGLYLAINEAIRDLESGPCSLNLLRRLTQVRLDNVDEIGHNAQGPSMAYRAAGAHDGHQEVLRRIQDLARVLRLPL